MLKQAYATMTRRMPVRDLSTDTTPFQDRMRSPPLVRTECSSVPPRHRTAPDAAHARGDARVPRGMAGCHCRDEVGGLAPDRLARP